MKDDNYPTRKTSATDRLVMYLLMLSWAWLALCILATVVVVLAARAALYRVVLVMDLAWLVNSAIELVVAWRRTKPAKRPEVAP